jgi:hypothetical protein
MLLSLGRPSCGPGQDRYPRGGHQDPVEVLESVHGSWLLLQERKQESPNGPPKGPDLFGYHPALLPGSSFPLEEAPLGEPTEGLSWLSDEIERRTPPFETGVDQGQGHRTILPGGGSHGRDDVIFDHHSHASA